MEDTYIVENVFQPKELWVETIPQGIKNLVFVNSTIDILPAIPEGVETIKLDETTIYTFTSFPSTLKSITGKYRYNDRSPSLPALPEGLVTIDLDNAEKMKILPPLPASLKTLRIVSSSINKFPVFPDGVETIDLTRSKISGVMTTEKLPAALKTLCLNETNIKRVQSYPPGLKRLEISRCPKIDRYTVLTDGLEHVSLDGIRIPAVIPASVRSFHVTTYSATISGPDPAVPFVFPAGLTELSIHGELLTRIPELPAGLQKLTMNIGLIAPDDFPVLPDSLQELDVTKYARNWFHYFEPTTDPTIPYRRLPAGLRLLRFNGYMLIVPRYLPLPAALKILRLDSDHVNGIVVPLPDLEEYSIYNPDNLAATPVFKPGLRKLSLSFCRNMARITNLPDGLETLKMRELTILREIPPLPVSLTSIDVEMTEFSSDMTNLVNLKELTLRLPESSPITAVPNLPNNLERLTVANSKTITQLPPFPTELLFLNVSYTSIVSISGLPNKLRTFVYHGTPLKRVPLLPDSLVTLIGWITVPPRREARERIEDYKVKVREYIQANPVWKGFTKSDMQMLNNMFLPRTPQEIAEGKSPYLVDVSFCPVCLAYNERLDGCSFIMGHRCMQNLRHERLYNLYKLGPQFGGRAGEIMWCTVCGRISGEGPVPGRGTSHLHYKGGVDNTGNPIPGGTTGKEVVKVGMDPRYAPFTQDCSNTGGGGPIEKIRRSLIYLNKALQLQKKVGIIDYTQAKEELVLAIWPGYSKEADPDLIGDVLGAKSYARASNVVFPDIPPRIDEVEPAPPEFVSPNPPIIEATGEQEKICSIEFGQHADARNTYILTHAQLNPDGSVKAEPPKVHANSPICMPDLVVTVHDELSGRCPFGEGCTGFVFPADLQPFLRTNDNPNPLNTISRSDLEFFKKGFAGVHPNFPRAPAAAAPGAGAAAAPGGVAPGAGAAAAPGGVAPGAGAAAAPGGVAPGGQVGGAEESEMKRLMDMIYNNPEIQAFLKQPGVDEGEPIIPPMNSDIQCTSQSKPEGAGRKRTYRKKRSGKTKKNSGY